MDNRITTRIAIEKIDFEEIAPPMIFKIIESEVGRSVTRVGYYCDSDGNIYAVCEFTSKEQAKKAYDNLDNVEIQQTGNILQLSFIPDDFELDQLMSECTDSENFVEQKIRSKRIEYDENMIELSQEIEIDFEIPEEHRTKPKVEKEEQDTTESYKQDVEESSIHHVLDALKEKEHVDEAEYEFDLKDERFKELYEDEDFVLDASNKKYKLQKSSKLINEKKFKEDNE